MSHSLFRARSFELLYAAPVRSLLPVALVALGGWVMSGASVESGVLLPNPDGYWATPILPPQFDHAAVIIPDRDLLIVITPAVSPSIGAEVWAAPLSDGDAWIRLASNGPLLGPGFVAVYDPIGRQVLVQGGKATVPKTWALRLNPAVEWSEFAPAEDSPGLRWDHTAVYDPLYHRVILHGGYGADGLLPDTWEMRLRAAHPKWEPLKTRGVPPGARGGHAAVYDKSAQGMILFGGGDVGDASETWELLLDEHPAWRRLAIATGPGAARTQHTLVADPAHHRLLLHGGIDGSGIYKGDTWEFRGGAAPEWTQLAHVGSPSPRVTHVAVFDHRRARMIVSGGWSLQGPMNDAWALDTSISRWDRLVPLANPSPAVWREVTSLSSTFARGRLYVLMGGFNGVEGQTWILDFAPNPRWSRTADAPARHTGLVYDASHDRLLMHGGFSSVGGSRNDTWEMLLGPSGFNPWRVIPTAEGLAQRRWNHVVMHDPRRNQLAVFGGSVPLVGCSIRVDVSLLNLVTDPATWMQIPQVPCPEGGQFPVGICDEEGDRLIVHGGVFGCLFPGGHPSGANEDGTWAYDLATPQGWKRLVPPGIGPRWLPDAAYDAKARRMVAPAPGTFAWELSLVPGNEVWRRLDAGGDWPVITNPSSFDYDPVRDRFVLVTSEGFVRYLLPSRGEQEPVVQRAHRGTAPPVLVIDTPIALAVGENPARGRVQLMIAIRGGAPGRLTLHDPRGRMVASRVIAAGTRETVTLDAPRGAPGVYFVRLAQGDAAEVRKVVVTD